ncbi:MAG: exonuclease SbcCD subunit D C-terminal domain-containing protein [Lewinella sp.]|nr:exonuclease SbcCD subunit D C-terminal domain-containing protein [Lewinella sp.]
MKVLHTADWHLGQKFLYKDREDEHRLALDWLLETIREQAIDALIVAGDIFDIGNPPNYARALYYSFLRQLLGSSCRHVVIVGGNHDSPAMLNAPRELLRAFNFHIIGSPAEDPAEDLLVLNDADGQPELLIAAVPFLRDRDLRTSLAGETSADRQERLQQGLTAHYQTLADLAMPYADKHIPILATGHLYAKGAVATDKQDNIYIGNRENMEASQFPEIFHYVALGHIHRPQAVGGEARIRYSGSLIPLSFSETKDDKSVEVLTFDGATLQDRQTVLVPVFRRLKTIQGDLPEVQAALDRFAAKTDRRLTPWVEVIVETEDYDPTLDQLLRDYVQDMDLELLRVRIARPYQSLAADERLPDDLEDLAVEEVFRQKCYSQGEMTDEAYRELLDSFRELQSWMQENEAQEARS